MELEHLGIAYNFLGGSEVALEEKIPDEKFCRLKQNLDKFGICIVDNQKDMLVQKIKDAILEMIYLEEELPNSKTSIYLSEKLNLSYGYITNLFSEQTLTTIENYIILQKIERAKDLIISGDYNLTEISYKLKYSSVAHLSNQFKKTTGLTPSAFQRIVNKRKVANQMKSTHSMTDN
jgi:AraC-like DNA-binding protein